MTRIPITPAIRARLVEQGVTLTDEEARPKSRDAVALETIMQLAGFPPFVAEYAFHRERCWRFDYAWPSVRVAVEIEGAIWQGRGKGARHCPVCHQPQRQSGRHNNPAGFLEDLCKYSEAACMGWIVIRCTDREIKSGQVLVWIDRAFALRRDND